jgi:hypothetical protein
MEESKDVPLPEQHEGTEKNIESNIVAASIAEAKELYEHARKKLLNVNKWHKWAGALTADFQLTDRQGKHIEGDVSVGNFFKIDIPGPGSTAGKGYDWVEVEEIKEDMTADEDMQFTLVRVRPSSNPSTDDDNVAHFFSDKATSNFVVKREKNKVIAAVYGRNEKPNTETNNAIDKTRNAVIGVTAIAGVSTAQWKSLVNGLLQND